MKYYPFLTFLLYFAIFISLSLAIPNFEVNLFPIKANASQKVLLNFTIKNIGSTNITDINITLPLEITFSGNANSSRCCFIGFSDNTLIFSNSSSLIDLNTNQSFWFEAFMPNFLGNFTFSILGKDFEGTNSTLINITVVDEIPPTWENIVIHPKDLIYEKGKFYQINVTWKDNVDVNVVLIEHNFTGNLKNETVKRDVNIFSFNISDLAAGVYVWRMIANDTSSNLNSTPFHQFKVEKAPNIIKLFLNQEENKNITIFEGQTLKIFVNASSLVNITLFKNNTLIAYNFSNQLFYSEKPLKGTYLFLANSTGNQNYTSNSTGQKNFVFVLEPRPQYIEIKTSIPSVYKDKPSIFNITWFDFSDPKAFNVAIFETNNTGTPKNYTMFRFPNTNISSFNLTYLPGTYYWKVYANNSLGKWNFTKKFVFTIQKATPTLILKANPSWTIEEGQSVQISCDAVENVGLKLYRNNTLVTNPDSPILQKGNYLYKCISSETQIYKSVSVQNILKVVEKKINISYEVNISNLNIQIIKGFKNHTSIKIKNKGQKDLNVSISLENIDLKAVEIQNKSFILRSNETFSSKIIFNSTFLNLGDNQAKIVVKIDSEFFNKTIFIKVLPKEEDVEKLNQKLANLTSIYNKFSSKILNLKEKGYNLTEIENLLKVFEKRLDEGRKAFRNKNYNEVEKVISILEDLSNQINSSLIKFIEVEKKEEPIIDITFIIILTVSAVASLILIYLFWPIK